jgi:hypothetical protein
MRIVSTYGLISMCGLIFCSGCTSQELDFASRVLVQAVAANSADSGSFPSSGASSSYQSSSASAPVNSRASYYAPLTDPTCVEYETEGSGSLYAQITNTCSVPVIFHWCWVPVGASNCTPDSTSDIIPIGSTVSVHGPARNQQPLASFIACDMSGENSTKTCNMNSPIPQ